MSQHLRATRSLMLAAAVSLFAAISPASAQDNYPARPIEMITPYPPGGVADIAIRVILPFLSRELGNATIVPINRAGAGGQVGADFVLRQPADGYTIFNGGAALFTTARALRKDGLGFTIDNFTVLGSFGSDPIVVVTSKDAPFKTMEEFVKYAKANPGVLSVGDGGLGGLGHFVIEAIKIHHGLDVKSVHFQGAAQLIPQVLGKHVPVVTAGVSTFLELIKSGELIPLVLAQEHPDLPNAPSATKLGLDNVALLSGIQTIVVRKETPKAISDRLAAAIEKTMSNPEFIAAMDRSKILRVYKDPAASLDDLAKQYALTVKIVTEAKIEAQ